jgi:hypothetical protein
MPPGSNFTNNYRAASNCQITGGEPDWLSMPLLPCEHDTWHYIHIVYFMYTFILPNYSSFLGLYSVLHILMKVMYTSTPSIHILMYTALVMLCSHLHSKSKREHLLWLSTGGEITENCVQAEFVFNTLFTKVHMLSVSA